MAGRRSLLAIVLLAAALHASGIIRATLPAQDGLKFIRVARQFQSKPWTDVVRESDQHPLYPALIALAEPVVASVMGRGPEAWRISAQGVAALASLALLWPLHGLTRSLFDDRIARLALLVYVLLPLPATIGHDTLSDSLAMLGALWALRLGEVALRSGGWPAPLGCGIAAGLGYLARPEVAVAPVAVVLTAVVWRRTLIMPRPEGWRLAATALSFLVMVGSYALIKGEVSEKLALRQGAALGPSRLATPKAGHWLPPGLDDPRWDFSPKEESESETEPEVSTPRTVDGAVRRIVLQWAEALCGVFAVFAAWGVVRDRFIRSLVQPDRVSEGTPGRWLLATYSALFGLALVRHAVALGYLSDRHTQMLVVVAVPWASAGMFVCGRGLTVRLGWEPRRARLASAVVLIGLVAAGVVLQSKPAHASRWGHREAGLWLVANSGPGDAVLDTRGWAAFVSGRPSYDYWHVRQAFTDAHLAYVVVGTGELSAPSRRAETLRAVLAYAAEPVAEFSDRRDGHGAGVRIYRYHRPDSWEGLRR